MTNRQKLILGKITGSIDHCCSSIGRKRHNKHLHRLFLNKVSKTWAVNIGKGLLWIAGRPRWKRKWRRSRIGETIGRFHRVRRACVAVKNNLPYAILQNKAQNLWCKFWICFLQQPQEPSRTCPKILRVSINNAGGNDSYPISGSQWLWFIKTWKTIQGTGNVKFLKWAMNEDNRMQRMYYAPLPKK